MAIEKVGFGSHYNVNGDVSRRGSFSRSNVIINKCGKMGHIQKYWRSKVTVSSGNPSKKSQNELPEWVTKKTVVLYIKDLATPTMTQNNKKYNWCNACNNFNGVWGFY